MAGGFVKQQFIQELNRNSLFGPCNPDDLVTADIERKTWEKKALKDKIKRDEKARQRELKKKKQEEEDYHFALQEQNRINFADSSVYSTMGRGRIPFRTPEQSPRPRGRGRLTQSEKEKWDGQAFFKKEMQIKNQLQMTNGLENYHSNHMQKMYWHGEKTPPLERFSLDCSSPEKLEDSESVISSPEPSRKSYTSSPTPQVSPLPASPLPQPSSSGVVRKRVSRIAANFSLLNVNDDSVEPTKKNEQSEVFMSSEPSRAPFRFRNDNLPRGSSINSLTPSERILHNELLRPEDLYDSGMSSDSYQFKYEDFPPLK